jgi:4-alpha-glucanotransferase
MNKFPRRSGILLHPTSLPGPFGIGDLGEEAYRFIDFLSSADQSYWQILPLSPTGYADSPYQGLSAFASNPMLISLTKLAEIGHLTDQDLANIPAFSNEQVNFGKVIPYKTSLLEKAFARFQAYASDDQRQSFIRFCTGQATWLDDFSLFMAIKEAQNLRPWYEWDTDIAHRQPQALVRWYGLLKEQIESQKYRQWQFSEQWLSLKRYANQRGIQMIGDIPIFVSLDSADVWANLDLFYIDENLQPTVVSGVPPDYFSKTGQLWGNPLYRWDKMEKNNYAWWIARFRHVFTQADVIRIDHFRGFYNYWEVPGSETTATRGQWFYGPGEKLFDAVTTTLGDIAIIAEDLGDFNTESRAGVDALQAKYGYPGMKVFQFAFDGGPNDPFLPYNISHECVMYTGTHDNNTTIGWYQQLTKKELKRVLQYLGTDGSDIAWDLIRVVWSSVANTAIAPIQDLLRLGHEARMNTPATCGAPNWCWRMQPGVLTDELATKLRGLTNIYGRTNNLSNL